MARQKSEGEVTLTSEEVALMRREIAELKAKVQSQKPEPIEEIRRASVRNMQGGEQISIKHFTDHKKVNLYHANGFHIGKKIGPLHPGLLEHTYARFKDKGITLSVTCPSESEIEAYKNTDEFNVILERRKETKPQHYKKISSSETEKTIAAFAKIIGVRPDEAVQLKPQEAVLK